MLIDPASNVSVPFVVVMRTRSRVPERALEPEEQKTRALRAEQMLDWMVQVFVPSNVRIADPLYNAAASGPVPVIKNPAVCEAEP